MAEVAVSTAVAFVAAVSEAGSVQCEADTGSPTAELVGGGVATGVAIGAITDSIMSSFLMTSAIRGGGAGTIRTDITHMDITRTITMDTAATTVVPGTVITMASATDTAVGPELVTGTATAVAQGMSEVCGAGNKGTSQFWD
jgi:hypothetical protein